jgi:hypothetical protein
MTPESWQRVTVLFEAVRELGPGDRRAFLERKCAGDASLLAQVLDLLDHDHEANHEGFLGAASRPMGSFQAQADLAPAPDRPASRPDRNVNVKVVLNLDSDRVQTSDVTGLLRDRMHVSAWILVFAFSAFLQRTSWTAPNRRVASSRSFAPTSPYCSHRCWSSRSFGAVRP